MTAPNTLVVFYHDPCIDGAASAWAVYAARQSDASLTTEFVPLPFGRPEERHKKIMSRLHDGVEVLFVDTSPKKETLGALLAPEENGPKIRKLTVIDHHSSEIEDVTAFQNKKRPPGSPEFNLVFNATSPSAAALTWAHFHPGEEQPALFDWLGKMEPPVSLETTHEQAIAAFIDSKDISNPENAFSTIGKLVKLSENDMAVAGNSILADQLNNIRKALLAGFLYTRLEVFGNQIWFPIVNANVQVFGRTVDQALLHKACEGTTCGVSGAWVVQNDGTVSLSLRAKSPANAGAIARHLAETIGVGGGGHPSSAVVQFKNLLQFSQNVPLYTGEQMREEIWASSKPNNAPAEGNRKGAKAAFPDPK